MSVTQFESQINEKKYFFIPANEHENQVYLWDEEYKYH